MNIRVVLLSIAVVVTGGVAWYLNSASEQGVRSKSQPLFKKFATEASQLDSILIENQNGEVFKAQRNKNQWLATHLDQEQSFPVNKQRMTTMINRVLKANVIEQKTSKAEYYPRLGVAGITDDSHSSARLTLTSKEQSRQVIIGNMAQSRHGTFVRRPDDKASLLINERVLMPESETDWLAQKVLPFDASELLSIRFTQNNTTSLLLMRSEQNARWEVVQVDNRRIEVEPQGLAYPGVIEQAVQDITDFRFLGVSAYFPEQWQQQEPVGQVTFTLADQQQITAYLVQTNELNQYQVWFDDQNTSPWLSGWVFEVSGYQGRALMLTLDDLTESG